jgi:tetratricopeptide (TPR) repeat protein
MNFNTHRGAHAPSRAVSGALAGNLAVALMRVVFRFRSPHGGSAGGARGRTPRHARARVLPVQMHPLFILVLPFVIGMAVAAPLDEQIEAFRKAPKQDEQAVISLLQTGLKEQRSAEVFAATRPWLTANPSNSPTLLFHAGKAAENAGEWQDAVSFYRKLLKLPSLDATTAGEAVTSTYRLLIQHLADPEAAYLFMREDGGRLRAYGRAKQYDAWFLETARTRNDLAAVSARLALLCADNAVNLADHSMSIDWVLSKLETFRFEDEHWYPAAQELAKASRLDAVIKARIAWAAAVVIYNRKLDEARNAKRPPANGIIDAPLAAAAELMRVSPDRGPFLVMQGWTVEYDNANSGNAVKRMEVDAARKVSQLLAAVPFMPLEKRDDLLAHRHANTSPAFPAADVRKLLIATPAILTTPFVADVPLVDAALTVEDAKALAPHLARSPHPQAALVRAFASGERNASAVTEAMIKTEMWRFQNVKTMADLVWNSGIFQRDAAWKNKGDLPAPHPQLLKQVSKKASAGDRTAAMEMLAKDLSGASPTIPAALHLWGELFANASDADAVAMLKKLLEKQDAGSEFLLRQALASATFGKSGKMPWQAVPHPNHFVYHQDQTRKLAAELITQLGTMLKAQAQAGVISETIFGMWLHSVDPRVPANREWFNELSKSPAYAKLDSDYRTVAMDAQHFGALTVAGPVGETLPANTAPAQVEAAFQALMARVSKSPSLVTLTGLQAVAAMPEWSAPTRDLVLSLFRDNAPLVAYPGKSGYEALVVRVANDFREAKQWGAIEPYAAGLWKAAAVTDDERSYAGVDALVKFAEAAHEAGASSAGMSVARGGIKSGAVKAMAIRQEPAVVQINSRLRQLAGKTAAALGAVEIPVDEANPAWPIYKSNSEFVLGNEESAWQLYLAHKDQLAPVLRSLSVEYAFWLLRRNIEGSRDQDAESLIKELTIWSRQAEGTFSLEQDARLKIAYADLAFRKGALPTARAWYRKVAEAAEYQGSEMHLISALGSVKVDRVSKNFGAAMTELDTLMKLKSPEFRKQVRYARAEVLMDQESYAEALDEIEQVLRQEPKHADALILRGRIHYEMRKLVEASEIELGPSQDKTLIVPGEAVKINLRDPTLNVSGVGADIEVEIRAKSGDSERVLLYQLGDSKEKFRAEVPTALGPPTPGDKILQVLGVDEIRFGYSERFRAKMKDLPADPDVVIGVASDARLAFSAGAFPPREGERRLNIEELGLSTAQAALGTRAVRPGNPVYLRVTDPDHSITSGIDEVTVGLQTSSGDVIRQLVLKETAPFSGEFEGVVPTAGAQALAFASESAPGRDPNMAISSKEYPGWQGNVGNAESARVFGIDLNDNIALDKMRIDMGEQKLTRFVLQTSMDGKHWTTRARFPEDTPVWDGTPLVTSFATFGVNSIPVSKPLGRKIPADWAEIMDQTSNRASISFLSAKVKSLSAAELPFVMPSHPAYGGVIRYRAMFHQPAAAIRRFQLTGLPDDGNTIFVLNGSPAAEDAASGFLIERELLPGLHEIEIWRHEGRGDFLKHKPVLLCDESGKQDLIPCPDAMFDPATFPEETRAMIPQTAALTAAEGGAMDVAFGDKTRARMVRLVIHGFEGVAPTIRKITLAERGGKALIPVAQDFMTLRENTQLEVLPGDQIIARYDDPRSATPKRNRQEQRLTVAFNDAVITASFLNYKTTEAGRELLLEPIRRFRYDDAIAIVIDDADMDGTQEKDIVEIKVVSSSGGTATIKAVETEEHSGRFLGRVFPVTGEPARASEVKVAEGGTLTASYLDTENLSPGIPTERKVLIEQATWQEPALATYHMTSDVLPEPKTPPTAKTTKNNNEEVVKPRRTLNYQLAEKAAANVAVAGSTLRFDLVVPHLALAGSSEIHAYVQTGEGRKAMKDAKSPFDVAAPGTMKLTGTLTKPAVTAPSGYQLGKGPLPPTNEPPLEEGRFSFVIPLILGDLPDRSFATNAAEALAESAIPDGLAVKAGDIVHVGYAYKDTKDQVQWKTADFKVESHAFLDVMDDGYQETASRAFVGEKIHIRLIDRGLDRGAERDVASVSLETESGAKTDYELQETESHSGIFKGVFALSFAEEKLPAKLPPVALNGFPVRYGDHVSITHAANGITQSHKVAVNMGADGVIEPFSKRFSGDEMAMTTGFTLAECFFELAKKHREMEQESLARREIGQARKLLAEAIANHRDDSTRAHAEYLLGNLAQEYADLAKNEQSKLPMYQDALARFSKIPSDYPDTEFAPKAQFKTALVYEKMGETTNAVEEYVKLAYKYPDHELIPSVMSRLGGYFQETGLAFKKQADALRENKDDASKAEVLRLDGLSYPEFLNAAMVFAKLQQRFPDDPLAGLAGLRAGQNHMRAHQYQNAIKAFTIVFENDTYDDKDIRSQAIYWCGLSHERFMGLMSDADWRGRGENTNAAYKLYRRVTFDFPDSIWAKYARGRLADPVFAQIIELENQERDRMIESLKESRKKR